MAITWDLNAAAMNVIFTWPVSQIGRNLLSNAL